MNEKQRKKKEPNQRNRHLETVITVAIVVILVVLAAAGLWILSGEGNRPSDKLVFTVGEEKVYLDEVNFCILQNMVNLRITADALNNTTAQDGTGAAEYYKQEILDLITDYKVEAMVAEKRGMLLSKEEESSVRNDAVQFMGSVNAGVLNELGITQDMVIRVSGKETGGYRDREYGKGIPEILHNVYDAVS